MIVSETLVNISASLASELLRTPSPIRTSKHQKRQAAAARGKQEPVVAPKTSAPGAGVCTCGNCPPEVPRRLCQATLQQFLSTKPVSTIDNSSISASTVTGRQHRDSAVSNGTIKSLSSVSSFSSIPIDQWPMPLSSEIISDVPSSPATTTISTKASETDHQSSRKGKIITRQSAPSSPSTRTLQLQQLARRKCLSSAACKMLRTLYTFQDSASAPRQVSTSSCSIHSSLKQLTLSLERFTLRVLAATRFVTPSAFAVALSYIQLLSQERRVTLLPDTVHMTMLAAVLVATKATEDCFSKSLIKEFAEFGFCSKEELCAAELALLMAMTESQGKGRLCPPWKDLLEAVLIPMRDRYTLPCRHRCFMDDAGLSQSQSSTTTRTCCWEDLFEGFSSYPMPSPGSFGATEASLHDSISTRALPSPGGSPLPAWL